MLTYRRNADLARETVTEIERVGRHALAPSSSTSPNRIVSVAAVQAAVPLMDGRPGRIVAVSGIDSHQAMARHGELHRRLARTTRRLRWRRFGSAT